MTDDTGWGRASPSQYDEASAHAFMVKQHIGRIRTSAPVKVLAVYPGDPMANPPTPTTWCGPCWPKAFGSKYQGTPSGSPSSWSSAPASR